MPDPAPQDAGRQALQAEGTPTLLRNWPDRLAAVAESDAKPALDRLIGTCAV